MNARDLLGCATGNEGIQLDKIAFAAASAGVLASLDIRALERE
jgi:hypothetical protein